MRKKSIRKAVEEFQVKANSIDEFCTRVSGALGEHDVSWCYEYAVIRLYRDFEDLMLNCLVALINNDTETLSKRTNIDFPRHLSVNVCEYLIVGNGFFDFKGRDGLISTLGKYLPKDHWLVDTVKDRRFRPALDRLAALRNYAAHDSSVSKKAAMDVTEHQRSDRLVRG